MTCGLRLAGSIKVFLLLVAVQTGTAQPIGHIGYTSRANCINNESITFLPFHSRMPRIVESHHYDYQYGVWHMVRSGSQTEPEFWVVAWHVGEGLKPRLSLRIEWRCGFTFFDGPLWGCRWCAVILFSFDRWFVEGHHFDVLGIESDGLALIRQRGLTQAADCNFDGPGNLMRSQP